MKVAHRIIEPAEPALPNTVITMGNTMGNSLEGNGGDKAVFLSRLLNMRVCAYQRPGTGSDPPRPSHRANSFLHHTQQAAEYLGGVLDKEGAERVIIASHSADGPFGLGMVLAGRLPVVGFAASDPAGVRRITSLEGFIRWARYQRRQAEPGHPSPETPEEWKAPPEVSDENVQKEIRLNHRIWREPCVRDGLRRVARMAGVAVQVVFPEHSFNGSPDFMRRTAAELNALGENRVQGSRPFYVGFEPGRAHRFYDDPRYYGGLLVDTLVSLGHQPEEFVHEMFNEPTFRHAGATKT